VSQVVACEPPVTAQSALVPQPTAHTSVGAQKNPCPHVFVPEATHCTQNPIDVSQCGRCGVVRQSRSLAHRIDPSGTGTSAGASRTSAASSASRRASSSTSAGASPRTSDAASAPASTVGTSPNPLSAFAQPTIAASASAMRATVKRRVRRMAIIMDERYHAACQR
jgi:hypothetical protein